MDTDKSIQNDFLGVNAIYHGFAFMPEQVARGMNDADRAREFDRVRRMQLKIARTWYTPDWACGDSIDREFDWESPKMKAFYSWLSAMKEIGVDVALQGAWSFPADMYRGRSAPDPAHDLPRFTQWLSESLHQIIEVRGFHNVRYLMLFVEPTQTERRPLPPGETTWSYYVKTVDAINDRLVADGRRNLVKLVGPNNSRDGYHLKEAVAELNKIIDIYSGHGYNKPGHADFLQVAQSMSSTAAQTGKPFWFDEYGISGSRYDEYRASGDYGTYLAEIVTATMNAGHQTSFFWELFDQLYIALAQLTNADSFYLGIQRTGTCKWPHDALVINPTYPWPSWYAFSLLSRYLGGGSGTRTLKTTGSPGLVVAATAPGDREFAVLVINTGKLERKFRVVFSSPVRRPLYRYPYSPGAVKPTEEARLIGYDRAFHKPGKNLDDTLGGRSFAIYTTIGGEGAASGRAASR